MSQYHDILFEKMFKNVNMKKFEDVYKKKLGVNGIPLIRWNLVYFSYFTKFCVSEISNMYSNEGENTRPISVKKIRKKHKK